MLEEEILREIRILNKRMDLLETKFEAYREEGMTEQELKDLINALKKY